MGTGKQYALHEIDETRAAGQAAAFDEILDKIEAAGGEITRDELSPLYTYMGSDEVEMGEEREVEFNLNEFDFLMTRTSETHRMNHTGTHKTMEKMDRPMIKSNLKKKKETDDQWEVVDLEDMF